MIGSEEETQRVKEWRQVVETALEQKGWATIREARLAAPRILVHNLEFEFPESLPDAAYAEPDGTTQD
eukprot:13305571-Alexandrium_andersonii.AAC.1